MNDLGTLVLRRIEATGPVSVADYMADCLLHPEFGYYNTRDPFGEAGDFTTAPEISQMFGELLGLCLAQTWMDQGQPSQFCLAELGPGRGTLMADILRVTKMVPGFHEAMHPILLEASPALRRKQKEILQDYQISWIADIAELPENPLFLIANEFFDALPIRQFSRDDNGWREHQIVSVNGKLSMGLSAPAPLGSLDHRLADTKSGDTVETRPSAEGFIQTVSERIAQYGGVALIIDYGDWRSLGDTFQAVKDHKAVSPLAEPGLADLTAHVDFEALVATLSDTQATPMVRQSDLLKSLGIDTRAQQLAANLEGDELESHNEAHRRLTHPLEMGTLFKAIAFYPKNAASPPGFET
ncbi:MAG: SAM-dependent methyltransferase [Paracoccaceae bacterium]